MVVKISYLLKRQLLMFLVVGLITLAIDVFVSWSTYNYLDVSSYTASCLGFMAGFAFNFPANRHKVFSHTSADRFKLSVQVTMFSMLVLFNLFVSTFFTGYLVEQGIFEISMAKIMITAIIASWNFFILKNIVFSKNNLQ